MAQILFKRKLKSGFVLLQLLKNKASCLNIGRKSQYIYICIYIYIYICDKQLQHGRRVYVIVF